MTTAIPGTQSQPGISQETILVFSFLEWMTANISCSNSLAAKYEVVTSFEVEQVCSQTFFQQQWVAEKVGIGESCVVITGTSQAKAGLNFWEPLEVACKELVRHLGWVSRYEMKDMRIQLKHPKSKKIIWKIPSCWLSFKLMMMAIVAMINDDDDL